MNAYLPLLGSGPSDATVRLFCFPHAGGGASAYRDWRDGHAPSVDVQPVQLPGRESLFSHRLIDDARELVDLLGSGLRAELRPPFAFFGHSMGATIASELVAWLYRNGGALPETLIVAGRSGELQPPTDHVTQMLALDDDRMLKEALALGGTRAMALSDPELRKIVARVLRNDYHLCAEYRATFRQLPVPIVALGGDQDPWVPINAIRAWQDRTITQCDVHILGGDHFFVHSNLPAVTKVIASSLGVGRTPC